jgi:hypothetical protein
MNAWEESIEGALGRPFPRFEAPNVAGDPTTVPVRRAALGYLVLLQFVPGDDVAARSWLNPGRALFTRLPGVRAFWVLAFESSNPFTRWAARRRLGRLVQDSALRRITVPVFGRAAALRRDLALPAGESVFLLAVDAEGVVREAQAGAWSFEKERLLVSRVNGTSYPRSRAVA